MEALEGLELAGALVADLGCGSGILGISALALGASQVLASDTDSLAVRATAENSALNQFSAGRLQVAQGSAEALALLLAGRRAEVLLCNILAPVLAELGPSFEGLVSPTGVGLLSGLLVEQVEPLVAVLEPLGWRCRLGAEQSRWALLEIRRA
jgi:ribosomal protein L11 methyltransferase